RWRFAGLPVVVIGLLLGPPTAPDLLMSDDGRVLGLRDEKGVVHVASSRVDRFVADTWARRSGQEGAKRWLASADEEAAGLGCQAVRAARPRRSRRREREKAGRCLSCSGGRARPACPGS